MYTGVMEGWPLRKPSALWKLYSSSFPYILVEPHKCCIGSNNPSVDFIINMREGAAKVGVPVQCPQC